MNHNTGNPGREGARTGCDPADEAVAAIEELLRWSYDGLSGLIGLGTLISYLEAGGQLAVVAPRIHREVDRTATAFQQLPGLLARITAAASTPDPDEPRAPLRARAGRDHRRAS